MKHPPPSMHPDLLAARKLAYEPCGLFIEHFALEKESQEYAASTFTVNQRRIQFRIAKITPTKKGQFVTFWKRLGNGPIQPFDQSDPFDLFVIGVRNKERLGQFVFPKLLFAEKGIITTKKKEGKRALRIYPPWDEPDNKQASHTQAWQLPYFFEISPSQEGNLSLVQKLFLA